MIGTLIRFGAPAVRYDPWPEDGLTLGEARERTVDRVLWSNWRTLVDRRQQARKAPDTEREINGRFQEMLRQGRLIAIGRHRTATAEETIIESDFWSSSVIWNWTESAVTADEKDGRAFHAVRVCPILYGPTRVDALAGLTLVEVMNRYVFGDPEVAARSVLAMDVDPILEAIFKRGHSSIHGARHWPLWINDHPKGGDEDEYLFGWAMTLTERSALPEPYTALRSFEDRVDGLLKLLREGSLAATGLPVRDSDPIRIPRSLWSHQDFRVDLERGDFCEENPLAENPPVDFVIKRWSGLMICRGDDDLTSNRKAVALPARPAAVDQAIVAAATRPRPKSNAVLAALEAAGIDLATERRSPSQVASAIADLLPWSVSQAHQMEALAAIVRRLKRQQS